VLAFFIRPCQAVHPLIGLLPARVIDLAIIFQRAVLILLHAINQPHHRDGGIPRVHQHRTKGQPLVIDRMCTHVRHMIQFAFAIAFWIVNA
jgi:hypothetical protein